MYFPSCDRRGIKALNTKMQLDELIGDLEQEELLIIKDYMVPTIDKAMYTLATTKAEIYNKNKIKSKIKSLNEVKLIDKFNPGSSMQKQEFFKFYGIESDKETKAGNPQWDRDALEELQKLLKTMIEDKE